MIIQIITDEWIDVINLDDDNISKRSYNNDSGTYTFKNNKAALCINWDKWGLETFTKINNIYYNCKNDIIHIPINNSQWNDIGIFNIKTSRIVRKHYPSESGIFYFENNDLSINWDNWGVERFYQFYCGKRYSSIQKTDITHDIKIIAIVFPQFHEIPENNRFWGDGFTEWTLLKNIPRIVNGEIIKQPHSDIGYFDLTDFEHRKYMRILADRYNIFGFCFYHYWFKIPAKKVMYKPTELMLLDGEPDKPFFFCWANEQWTKRWDGGNNEILLEQEYSDYEEHFDYLLQFFKHKNYIKHNNKPVFIFYRIEEKDINHIRSIISVWNNLSKKKGFNGIHFMKFLGPFNNDIKLEEIDGYVEFQPGYGCQENYNEICIGDKNKIFTEFNEEVYLQKNSDIRNLGISGRDHYNNISAHEKDIRTNKFFVYDGQKLFDKIIESKRVHKEYHRGICTSWNNTPRRNYTSDQYDKYPHYYKNITVDSFSKTFKKLLKKVDNDPNEPKNSENYIFISAWNEWNEQAILEPNNEDGYNYLSCIKEQYLNYVNVKKHKILNISHLGGGTEKYMKDIKKIFSEYTFLEYTFAEESDFTDISLIHINSVLFNVLKDNHTHFFSTFYKDVKKYITVHDYQWLYPDDPNILKENFNLTINQQDINSFRFLLSICDKIIFPTYNIFNNYNNKINLTEYLDKIHIVNHMDKIINYSFYYIPYIIDTINIAFIGYFIEYKGSNILKDLANKTKSLNIKYHIFGSINEIYIADNIVFHNTYSDNEIIKQLHENNIHGITHLSLFEESYCYALTNSINSGLPIFYIDRGAISERLKTNTYADKYFPTSIDTLYDDFTIFLQYIIKMQGTNIFHNMQNNVQPNRWYLTNYNL